MDPRFTCSICSKSFDNKKSQIRHVSYCRKKARNPMRPRKRSCITCTNAKTHCDIAIPSCSRCLKRGVTCIYRNQTSGIGEDAPRQTVTRRTEALTPPVAFWDSSQVQHHGEVEEFNITSDYLFPDPLTFDDMPLLSISPQTFVDTREQVSAALIARGRLPSGSLSPPIQRHLTNLSSFPFLDSLPIEPALRPPKAFWPKRLRYRQLSLTRKYILCTLSTYPHMMLASRGLPPFMHPQCLIKEFEHDERVIQTALPGPLATCAGIIAMWSVKNKNNSVFIWRAIRTEQERLSEECSKYNDWNAVAAIQAICIYFLLRLSETDSEATDFDIPLILTMRKLAVRVQGIAARHCIPSMGRPPTWEGWILAESLRRTIFIIFIVDFLFELSPVTDDCDSARHLSEMLLPCPKSLWIAQTKSDWVREYTTQLNFHSQNDIKWLSFGHLLQHDMENGPFGDSLDRWIAQVDDFGAIVVAFASLSEGLNMFRIRGKGSETIGRW